MESSITNTELSSTYKGDKTSRCNDCARKNILNECLLCDLSNAERKEYLDNNIKEYVSIYAKLHATYI